MYVWIHVLVGLRCYLFVAIHSLLFVSFGSIRTSISISHGWLAGSLTLFFVT